MGLFNKKELKKISELEDEIVNLKNMLSDIGAKDYLEVKELVKKESKRLNIINDEIENSNNILLNKNNEIDLLNSKIDDLNSKLSSLEDDFSLRSFGFYKPKYNCMNSGEYAEKIRKIRDQQKQKVKDKKALSFFDGWTLDGSKAKGKAMNNDNMKMVLRAFNNECDVLISKAKFNNVDKIEDRIKKCAIQIDKLNQRNKISINNSYISLKIDELHACYEYEKMKQEEKDLLKEQRAQEREEAKLQKEIAEARKNITKEKTHYENALNQLETQLSEESSNKDEIISRINDIKNKLLEIDKNLKDIDYREANKKAGYVYIISNIGAFGEDIYKIGMTRRLEPMDRVDELGDASVPFKFDVHALIFSDDAPKLEAALHRAFEDKKVNMVNNRKEFFNVKLDEIEKVVKENHDKLVEFNKIPEAEQFRESLKLKENR